MARRPQITNGVRHNGDAPPPSTLAAQIVQNQTRQAGHPSDGEPNVFTQLLHELLNNPAAAQESDVQVNAQLISVVAEAGLAPLIQDNPFVQLDALLSRAVDSLAVIEATIRRQPEVLFAQASEDGPQLLLSLLARLTAVCGRKGCHELPIAQLLDSAIAALMIAPSLWQHVQTLHDCIQEVIDGE